MVSQQCLALGLGISGSSGITCQICQLGFPPNNETRPTIKELTASTKSQHSFFTKFEYRNCCIFLRQARYFHAKTYVP